MKQSNIHIFFILLVAGGVALLAYLTTAITEPTGIVAWLPTSTTTYTPSASYLEVPMQQPATSKASRTAVSSVLPTGSASAVSGAALPTYSGKAVQSYSGGMGSSMSNGLAVPMATATTHGSGLMMSTTKTSAHTTALPTSTQVVPTHNRMLAQGRRQAAGYYGGSVSGQEVSNTSGAIGGPRRSNEPTIEETWKSWLDEYYTETGAASGDLSGLEAWWNKTYAGGYPPGTNVYTDFAAWANSNALPIGDTIFLWGLLALVYTCYQYRKTLKQIQI